MDTITGAKAPLTSLSAAANPRKEREESSEMRDRGGAEKEGLGAFENGRVSTDGSI